MAFNNPSSRTPVSYASATKSLGYLAKVCMNAFNSEEQDEQQSLLHKAKNKGREENRVFVLSCCVCIFLLILVVVGFVVALKSLSYPHMIPVHKAFQKDDALKPGPSLKTISDMKISSRGRQREGSRDSGQDFNEKISTASKN